MGTLSSWLNNELKKKTDKTVHIHEQLIRSEGDWYYVPVYIDMRDAYDKAALLQKIENEWGKQKVEQGENLLLISAAR